MRVAVIAKEIHSPALAGSSLSAGIDGFGEDNVPATKQEQMDVSALVRDAIGEINRVVRNAGAEERCRLDMGYQLVGNDPQVVDETMTFLTDRFNYSQKKIVHQTDPSARVAFAGVTDAIETRAIGQINTPEFLQFIVEDIRRMGGEVVTGATYKGHEKQADGIIAVTTDNGTWTTTTPPLLALGPAHAAASGNLPVGIKPVYTGALHVQLSPEDAKALTPGGKPMAFCDTNLSADVLWGSLDRKGVLTIGFGDTEDPSAGDSLRASLVKRFGEMLPGLKGKYLEEDMKFTFGAMSVTDNGLPIAGRLKDFDVSTGWGERGIPQSFAFGRAYAKHVVTGDTADMEKFERLNISPTVGTPRPASRAPGV